MQLLLLFSLPIWVHSFLPCTLPGTSRLHPLCAQKEEGNSADNLFASEGWKPIEKDLNQVPVFTVATAEGNPVAYQIDVKGKSYTLPFFYCDVDAALTELEASRKVKDMEGMDIVPFPLGKAFQLWAKDEAVIIPSKEAVLQAGAPPGTNPIGQQVPMFCCLEIAEEGPDGKPKLPLFMALEDANAALKEAVEADGGKVDDFEVVCLSLNRAIDQLATSPESAAFRFLPPSKSMNYIRDYLS
eukprot:scaffold5364_cov164-Amphora_coffeaeformis.AAC.6